MVDEPLVIGEYYAFYTQPEKEEGTFEGWGKIIEIAEQKETFLLNADLYQLYRVKVEFTGNVPSDSKRGRLNNPFASKPFITHKVKRTLLLKKPSDKQISAHTFTPMPHQVLLGEAYYQNLLKLEYESYNSTDKDFKEPAERRKISSLELSYRRQSPCILWKRKTCRYSSKRKRETVGHRSLYYRQRVHLC